MSFILAEEDWPTSSELSIYAQNDRLSTQQQLGPFGRRCPSKTLVEQVQMRAGSDL